MIVKTHERKDGWELTVQQCNTITSIPLDPDGRMRGGHGFTPFWIYMKNPVINTVQRAVKNYEVKIVDPLDLFGGGKEAVYTLVVKKPFILWSRILQSQASYEMGIYDEKGVEVATAVVDGTCGLLFEVATHMDGAGRASLISTDFPISRNRYFLVEIAVVSSLILAIMTIVGYWRVSEEDKPKRMWEMKMVLWGIAACMVDIYADVWFPFAFGTVGLIVLHALAMVPGAIWFGWWIMPALVELLWSFNFAIQTEMLIPQLTHCPGLILSWMMAVMFFRTFRKKTEP